MPVGFWKVVPTLVAVALVSSIGFSAAVAAGTDGDEIALQNWAVDFTPVSERRVAVKRFEPVTDAVPSAASHFITMVPCRLFDTRLAEGAFGGPIMTANVPRTVNVPDGPCAGIPANAAAYSLAFTIRFPANDGFLTAWPTGATQPTVSTANYTANGRVTNAAIIPAGTNGSIDIFLNSNAHVVIDINGYFAEGVVTSVLAGGGLTGGGTGTPVLSIAPGGVTSSHLGASSVTTGAIANGTITAAKTGAGEVVKSINGIRDAVAVNGSGGAVISASGNTITVNTAALAAPPGSVILGHPGETSIINSGYTELGLTTIDAWRTPTATSGAPSARSRHSAVWTGTKMIVWGGVDGGVVTNTGGIYDPATNSWTATTLTGAPSARSGHSAVWTGSKMIAWGGIGAGNPLNSGGQYDPIANSWTPTATSGAPTPRERHGAVWSVAGTPER